MAITVTKTCGVDLVKDFPDSVEAFDRLPGGYTGAALEMAIQGFQAWVFNPALLRQFIKLAKDKWGLEPRSSGKTRTTKKGEVEVLESPQKFVAWVKTQVTEQDVAELLQQACDATPLSLEGTGGGRVSKAFVEKAESWLAAIDNGEVDGEELVAKLEALNPGVSIERDDAGLPETVSLALALKINEDRKSRSKSVEGLA